MQLDVQHVREKLHNEIAFREFSVAQGELPPLTWFSQLLSASMVSWYLAALREAMLLQGLVYWTLQSVSALLWKEKDIGMQTASDVQIC